MTQPRRILPSRPLNLLALLAALSVVTPHGALAANPDPMIEGARQCTQYFPVEEKKNNVPTHLLAAIATTESGRYHKGLGMSVPWPWTINVEGKGYYFDSKAEAIAQVQNLMAKGIRSIDVGCMQVNLKHHPAAFSNLNEAFDPATNVAYAAKFLRDNYATMGDWIKATAAYHSKTPIYGQQYLVDIERSWNRIVAKVAEARASKAATGETVAALGASTATAVAIAPATRTPQAAMPKVISMQKPMQPLRHARVIQVSDAGTRRESPVMVVREVPAASALVKPAPQAPAQALAVAEASVSAQPSVAPAAAATVAPVAVAPGADSVRRVSLDNSGAAGLPSVKPSSPKFVFAN